MWHRSLGAAPALLKLLYGPQFVTYAPSARVFAVSLVIGAFGIGPVLTLTTTRRIRPLFMVQLGRLVFSVAAVCVLSTVYGVTGAAAATLLTTVLTLAAVLTLQSWVRRSYEQEHRGLVARFAEAVRRVVRNAAFLLSPPNESLRTPESSRTP